ncbi:hypothetical protein [Mesonia phycicola]|nr:hypothetical protein [Mesonia phycicola]
MKNLSKTLTYIFIASTVILLVSCGSIIKTIAGIPKLTVYSQEEIDSNIKKAPIENNVIDAQLSQDLDTETIKSFIYMSIPYRTYIYDKNNSLMCYNGETHCGITQLDTLRQSSIKDNYAQCDSITLDTDIDSYLGNFHEITSKIILPKESNFDSYQYKILVFINTDISKDELIEDWNYIYNSLNTNNPETIFIRIWTDLNEDWGLKYGAKAKFKVRKVKDSKGEYYMTLPKLPYKK